VVGDRLQLQVQCRLEHVHLNLLARPGPRLVHERGQDAHGQQACRMLVDHRRTGRQRTGLDPPGGGGKAGDRLQQQVLAGQVSAGAVSSIT
jgi:hypothetical protein